MSRHLFSFFGFLVVAGAAAAGSGSPSVYREVPDDPPALSDPRRSFLARSEPAAVERNGYVSVQVNVDGTGLNIVGDAANEPSIAVDPTSPLNVVIGWRQFDSVTSNFRQAGWAFSRDGGATWAFPGVLEPGVFRSDPVLDADAEGRIFYQSLKVEPPPPGPFDITNQVFRSLDGGKSWLPGVDAFGNDKPWMTVDRSGGVGRGNVYVAWSVGLECFACPVTSCCETVLCCEDFVCCDATFCCDHKVFSRSLDSGASFDEPVGLVRDALVNTGFMTLAVGPAGEVYFATVEFGEFGFDEYRVYRSDDARDGGAEPTFALTGVDMGGAFTNGGPPNPDGLLGQPEVAVDPSPGPTGGYVYLLTSLDPPGADPLDVHFSRSTDGGATWSPPVRVNDDPSASGAWQWFGTFSVAPDGRIDAVWNDTRGSATPTVSELTYAYSYDGGETWSRNVPVSPPFDSTLGWPNQSKIGDYYDMVSDESGAAVAYAATFNGEQDVYFLRVFPDCNENGVSDVDDVAGGTSRDFDGDRVPDECEPMVLRGPDPGVAGAVNALSVEGAFAGSRIRFLWSDRQGSSAVAGCRGLATGLHRPRGLGQAWAGDDGAASIERRFPANLAGRTFYFQAVDHTACRTSGVVEHAFLAAALGAGVPEGD